MKIVRYEGPAADVFIAPDGTELPVGVDVELSDEVADSLPQAPEGVWVKDRWGDPVFQAGPPRDSGHRFTITAKTAKGRPKDDPPVIADPPKGDPEVPIPPQPRT